MKLVIQRVSSASVTIKGKVEGKINKGLMILVGIAQQDAEEDARYLAGKAINMRIFQDENDKMNLSLLDIKGEILAISQFTLLADTRKGRRPSFINAASPQKGEQLYDFFVNCLKEQNIKVETGIFGAMMDVALVNEGPVTIVIDSNEK